MPRMARRSDRQRALAQRARRDANRIVANLHVSAVAFEDSMKEIIFSTCGTCRIRARQSEMTAGQCAYCRRTDRGESINMFSAENDMNLGDIPSELSGLTMLEQVLIARVHPVVSVFKIRGQQVGYCGHVVNFVQHLETFATRLPHNPRNLSAVILLNRQTPAGLIEFRVRHEAVLTALRWLKQNNCWYHDIVIDMVALDDVPPDGDASQLLPVLPQLSASEPEENHVMDNLLDRSCVINLPNAIQSEMIARSIGVYDWPTVSQERLNEFNNEGIIAKAFPVLFPYGRGDLNSPRIVRIGKHEYFKYLMKYSDNRFARDLRFPYYAYNSLARWDAITCGNAYVRMHRDEALTREDLLELANNPDRNIAAEIMYYGASLRGTRSYWKQRCSELVQMVRQLGTPTVFFTLSAADYHWPDLYRILVPDMDPALITEKERRLLMHNNPMTVAWFFNIRCDVFLNQFIKTMFNVKDFWYRFEWQHRGSPHIHGFLWLEGAPNCDLINGLSEIERLPIVNYFDSIVSATIDRTSIILPQNNPCRRRYTDLLPEEKLLDLDRILSSVQKHTRCGTHCMRRKRNSRVMACRFGFPMALEDSSSLRLENGCWKFFPRRNDPLIQRYNRFISQVWRGNTDFSAITSKDAVINYISKYASKCEVSSAAYSEILARVIQRSPEEANSATLIRQLMVSSVAERNYSAQEVMHLLMGWPLFHASRTMTVLSLREEYQRVTGPASTSLTNKYSTRSDPDHQNMSLFHFAKNFYYRGTRLVVRQKECIVRIVPFLKYSEDLDENADYYKYQCKLHIPWRNDFERLLGDSTWRDVYVRHQHLFDIADQFGDELPIQPDEVQFESEEEDSPIVRDAGMAAARLEPNPREVDPIGQRPIDDAYEWRSLPLNGYVTEEIVRDFLTTYRSAPLPARALEPVILFHDMSAEQQAAILICRAQINDPNYAIRRIVVQGKAGTGKSAVIKAICRLIDDQTPNQEKHYEVIAPTGAAAVNVDGKTIHSLLRIPISGQLYPLNGETLRSFQLAFEKVRFIIIDEYSMIGLRMLHKIHLRLSQASGLNQPFGGYFIYFFGDLRQLPPVMDIAIFMPPVDDFTRISQALVNSVQKWIFLSVTHRQAADQAVFKGILDRIANGTLTCQDWSTLLTRRTALRPSNYNLFKDSIHLLPTNEEVYRRNIEHLSRNRMPIAIIDAVHNNSTAGQGSDLIAGGLARKLYLSLNCRVMLRRNLCVERGLVNGALGTVRDIIYHPDCGPPSLPYTILVQFDRYTGPFIGENCFPLLPVSSSWKDRSVDCSRKQFPIQVAYAFTIHKAQGLTLDRAVVDIGEKETSPGLSYVALSRVKRLDGLLLSRSFDFARLSGIGQIRQVQMREAFLEEIERRSR